MTPGHVLSHQDRAPEGRGLVQSQGSMLRPSAVSRLGVTLGCLSVFLLITNSLNPSFEVTPLCFLMEWLWSLCCVFIWEYGGRGSWITQPAFPGQQATPGGSGEEVSFYVVTCAGGYRSKLQRRCVI